MILNVFFFYYYYHFGRKTKHTKTPSWFMSLHKLINYIWKTTRKHSVMRVFFRNILRFRPSMWWWRVVSLTRNVPISSTTALNLVKSHLEYCSFSTRQYVGKIDARVFRDSHLFAPPIYGIFTFDIPTSDSARLKSHTQCLMAIFDSNNEPRYQASKPIQIRPNQKTTGLKSEN